MDAPHPPVLCSTARKWHEVPMSELADIFHTTFVAAHALPDEAHRDGNLHVMGLKKYLRRGRRIQHGRGETIRPPRKSAPARSVSSRPP